MKRPTSAPSGICSTSLGGRSKAPAARGITIVTRVDIGHWECDGLRTPEGTVTGCYKAKDFGPAGARALLQPVVDRWVVGHVHVHGAQDLVSRYNTERVMFDEYQRIGCQRGARRRILRAGLDRAAAGGGGPHDLPRRLSGPGQRHG